MPEWHRISTPEKRELLVGFYDLTGYMRLARQMDELRILEVMAGYFRLTGSILGESGGLLVKAIGDAGLGAFPAEDTERGVLAFLRLKEEGDAWLRELGIESKAVVKLHTGPVACGLVGAPGNERFDGYGKTVNTAAVLPANGFAMTPQVFRKLGKDARTLFKKHTPPIVYIGLEDPH